MLAFFVCDQRYPYTQIANIVFSLTKYAGEKHACTNIDSIDRIVITYMYSHFIRLVDDLTTFSQNLRLKIFLRVASSFSYFDNTFHLHLIVISQPNSIIRYNII